MLIMAMLEDIMDYEGGNMTLKRYFEFFGELIRTGQAWSLQGMYGRAAKDLIEGGLIDRAGNVNWDEINKREIDTESMLYDE